MFTIIRFPACFSYLSSFSHNSLLSSGCSVLHEVNPSKKLLRKNASMLYAYTEAKKSELSNLQRQFLFLNSIIKLKK